jgi:hypothetical protein
MAAAVDDDGATIDSIHLVERIIEDLEVMHIRALKVIADGPLAHFLNEKGTRVAGGTSFDRLEQQLPDSGGATRAIVATLVALGLVEDCAIGSVGYTTRWALTPFGEQLRAYLLDA